MYKSSYEIIDNKEFMECFEPYDTNNDNVIPKYYIAKKSALGYLHKLIFVIADIETSNCGFVLVKSINEEPIPLEVSEKMNQQKIIKLINERNFFVKTH